MLSIKERRIILAHVKSPEKSYKELGQELNVSASRVSKTIKKGSYYIAELQDDIRKRNQLSQDKEVKALKKIYKKSMKLRKDANGNMVPVNLSSALQARAQLQKITGLDQVVKERIEINTSAIDFTDNQYAEKVLMEIMQQFMNRKIDKEDLDALMKSLDTLASYKLGAQVQDRLDALGIDTGSIFDAPEKQGNVAIGGN